MLKFFALIPALLLASLTGLAEQPRHVVVIGDSHLLGAFGSEIRGFLRSQPQLSFDFVSSGGAAPLQFLNGIYKTPCGFEDHSRLPQEPVFECPNTLFTPKLSSLLHAPAQPGDTVVIALGANYSTKPEDRTLQLKSTQELVETALRAGYACLWIGPPNMPRFGEEGLKARYDLIQSAIGSKCTLIDSRPLSHYPETLDPVTEKPDGIHYDYPAPWWKFARGTEAARVWGKAVVAELQAAFVSKGTPEPAPGDSQ
jgi:hypothetical protein